MTWDTLPKTLKIYVGGRFLRSESGRTLPITGHQGQTMQAPRASRKDVRDAVGNLRGGAAGWAATSGLLKGQILYRLAEMLAGRANGLPAAPATVHEAADRAVHYAGWTDKLGALLSTVNPVAGTYVNYSRLRPVGVVALALGEGADLPQLVEATCRPLLSGNTVLLLVPAARAELALTYAECLLCSDLPGSAISVLTGELPELLQAVDLMDDLDTLALAEGALSPELEARSRRAASQVVRRVLVQDLTRRATPLELAAFTETQTVWMSARQTRRSGGGY
jgi:aldehyde dehydrogenase (NAD+)